MIVILLRMAAKVQNNETSSRTGRYFVKAVRGSCKRWWSGTSRWTVLHWLGAVLCWGALTVLTLYGAQWLPPHCLQPAGLLHPEPQTATSTSTPTTLMPYTDSRVISEDELNADLERRLPSLPYRYWRRHNKDKKKYFKKRNCAPFPSIFELKFHNMYWQSLYTSQGVFHFYGAYLDTRNTSCIGRAVRVLGVHDRIEPTIVTHCQLWFEERTQPTVVPILEYKYVWFKMWGNYRNHVLQPYLMTCMLPMAVQHLVPASVSIVENACDRATNNLRVHNDRPNPVTGRKEFAVCVKGLDFQHNDMSVRLVEWIELLKIMGVDKVFFYELLVHPNITKVLDYYKKQGTVTVTPITLPGGQPNLPGLQHMYLKKKYVYKRQMELIPYNDCLYRHMNEYRWLVLLDIDEVIVPVEDADWSSLMKRILPLSAIPMESRSTYYASNLYYLDSLRHQQGWEEGLPRYMYLLQRVYRTRNFTKNGFHVKAIHETDRVLALHNHFPLACIGGACSCYHLNTSHVRLQHYRADCDVSVQMCRELRNSSMRDTTLWRWRDPLVARTEAVLRALGFLPPHR